MAVDAIGTTATAMADISALVSSEWAPVAGRRDPSVSLPRYAESWLSP